MTTQDLEVIHFLKCTCILQITFTKGYMLMFSLDLSKWVLRIWILRDILKPIVPQFFTRFSNHYFLGVFGFVITQEAQTTLSRCFFLPSEILGKFLEKPNSVWFPLNCIIAHYHEVAWGLFSNLH